MDHNELLAAVESVIETSVRPQLQAHGGDVKLLSIEAGLCRVKLLGQCSGCPSAFITTEEIIRGEIVKALPEVKDVVLVTETSDELMNFAKQLMGRNRQNLK